MAIIDTPLEKESLDRYLTYAMSVVSGRALPDVRDGLKPVQRRILYAMAQTLGLASSGGHRKSATVVGEVLGKFHPHGDIACYEAMVRMAQSFSLRYPLVDGQGNFGSLDGDNAAAYRYTEVKLQAIAHYLVGEIEEETVNFKANFDGTNAEPTVFPSRIPNLLINGATGIAVGMATSMPPHNLRDTIKAIVELAEDPEISEAKLATTVKAPDFPTGCLILNTRKELNEVYKTGRGLVTMRAEWKLEEGSRGKRFIVVSSIPYMVNKSQLVSKIADLIVGKKIPQLNDVRDESTEDVRVVLELASNADAEIAMAYLFKHTPLQDDFPVNLTALVPSAEGVLVPKLLSLKECLQHFLDFREEVWKKKLIFEKKKLNERIHILDGLVLIYDALDVALKIVRSSTGRADAAEKLRARFKLTEIQAFAVVDMRIYQLSKTNIDEIREELKGKASRVKEIERVLKSSKEIQKQVLKDLEEVAEKFGDKRVCKLDSEGRELEFREEDYLVQEEVYAIVTSDGWIKRIRQSNELSTTRIREGDTILDAHPLSTLDSVAFFTNQGFIYVLSVSDFPSSSGYGDPVQKLLKFKDGEVIVKSFPVVASQPKQGALLPPIKDGTAVLLASQKGVGLIHKLSGLEAVKRNGKRVMRLRDGDALAGVWPFSGEVSGQVSFFTANGSGLTIDVKEVPVRDTPAVGVNLIGVRSDDKLVSVIAHTKHISLIVITMSDKEKEISTKDITAGRRGLKGTKVLSRDSIKDVKVKVLSE